MRETIIDEICKQKIIAIIRGAKEQEAIAAAKALYDGGITLVEVTFNQKSPETFVDTARTIRSIQEQMGNKMLVGAGTVTSVELVKMAADAGLLLLFLRIPMSLLSVKPESWAWFLSLGLTHLPKQKEPIMPGQIL